MEDGAHLENFARTAEGTGMHNCACGAPPHPALRPTFSREGEGGAAEVCWIWLIERAMMEMRFPLCCFAEYAKSALA